MKVYQTGIAVALLTALAVAGAAVAQQADTTKAPPAAAETKAAETKPAAPATPVKAAAPAAKAAAPAPAAKAEVAATPAKASAPAAKGSSAKSVIGEVVDPACWIVNGSKGEAHKECALACAKAGQVLGILERKTNKLFLLATDRPGEDPNKSVIDFCGQTVLAKGRFFTRGGFTAIQITSVEPYSARANP